MKKSLIAIAIALTFAVAVGCTGGDGVATTPSSNSLVSPDVYYEIDTWGTNSEVYEFTPQLAPYKLCVYVITDSTGRPVMQCFDKQINR